MIRIEGNEFFELYVFDTELLDEVGENTLQVPF